MKIKEPRVKVEMIRKSGYGSVPGLDDEEPAGYNELLRQVMIEQWGPILDIPVKKSGRFVKPTIDERCNLDWGAFGTVDFERLYPFNPTSYKIDKLREELQHVKIMFDLVKERVPIENRLEIIRYVQAGKDIDLIEDFDQFRMAYRFSQLRAIQAKIKLCYSRLSSHNGD
jgi:hypothetical protein